MIKEYNYINIQGWMVKDLHLTGNKLLVYAIIFGFSQDDESEFTNGVKYLSDWIGCSYPTTLGILKDLEENGLISKREFTNEKGRFMAYRVIKNFNNGLLKNFITPYNIDNNKNKNNIYTQEESKNGSLESKKDELKTSFDEFWSKYPKQRAGSKSKAFSSYCRVIKEKRCTVEKLLEVCVKYAQSEEVKRGFAKGCAAWLNDDRFNNEYVAQTQKEFW